MNEQFVDKKIAVLGFGVEGGSVARFLSNKGARVYIFDEKEEKEFDAQKISKLKEKGVHFTFHTISKLFEFDMIVRSPGVRLMHHAIERARDKGVPITSATKLFFDLCPCPIIGVTGTKGKGTTSSLISEMLQEQGFDAKLGGNIGLPPLDFLDTLTKDSRVVLELSSFQLQDLHKSPHIAVFLMTTSEHLDYHKDVYEYVNAKRNILRFQTPQDFAIINKDYPASNESDIHTEAKIYKVSREQDIDQGCYVKDNAIWIKMSEHAEKVIDADKILLPGKHNLENVCAAVVAAIFGGAKMPAIVSVLKSFKGLEHRLELVATVKGVRYYNDSFSTTPETAMAAIEAFKDPEILILGGSSKNSDFTHLGQVIGRAKNIKAIIGIGAEWQRIKAQFQISNFKFQIIEGKKNMKEIVEVAAVISELGNVVLLSPACASFDMFKNYKDRGNQFKEEVKKLKENNLK